MSYANLTKMILGSTIMLISTSVVILFTYQNKLIYPSWAQNARKHVDTPDMYGLPYIEHKLMTRDNIQIRAYDMRNQESGTTILILCPNAGNIGNFLPIAQLLYNEFKVSVFIYSYRGYGLSEGVASEVGLKLDGDCVMEFLSKNEFYRSQKIVLYGRSLGGANAIYIARKFGQFCDAIILENTFLSIRKVIPYIYPFLKYFVFMCHEVWNSEEEIKFIDSGLPALFLNGLNDETVPPSHMRELFHLYPSQNKKLIQFPNGSHNDTIMEPGYWEIVYDFLEKYELI